MIIILYIDLYLPNDFKFVLPCILINNQEYTSNYLITVKTFSLLNNYKSGI